MNQTTATSRSLANVVGDVGTANATLVITYYIDNTFAPPRLMRQVSGHSSDAGWRRTLFPEVQL